MPTRTKLLRALALSLAAALAGACGGSSSSPSGPGAISPGEGTDIAGAPGWKWIPFDDAFCTDMPSPGVFSSSTTGLAVSWGTGKDLVIFLQGGGACWDFVTCGGAASLVSGTPTAATGPFGPAQFASDIFAKYPNAWVRREKMPAPIATATLVFVPYCTGDVHSGDKTTTYQSPVPGFPSITWRHVGHANLVAFLRRLGPGLKLGAGDKLVVAGSSAGGFGSLANYPTVRAQWPDAKGYLVDDSGPPLVGSAIPASSRSAWYASWNMGASLGPFCPDCQSDLSKGLSAILSTYPRDRVALLSHTQDAVIRNFFGTPILTPPFLVPKDPITFETELRALGNTVIGPAPNGRYFFTLGTGHPTLEDPSAIGTPAPGLPAWIEQMLSDAPG
ncbi:MAG TPA: pectin acetylesterase-family hydrolase, partial [Anaeromyxobacter sp.]|nr:pectin acetylesterase-family hydrolase [Anaeromyxobacter sp.]